MLRKNDRLGSQSSKQQETLSENEICNIRVSISFLTMYWSIPLSSRRKGNNLDTVHLKWHFFASNPLCSFYLSFQLFLSVETASRSTSLGSERAIRKSKDRRRLNRSVRLFLCWERLTASVNWRRSSRREICFEEGDRSPLPFSNGIRCLFDLWTSWVFTFQEHWLTEIRFIAALLLHWSPLLFQWMNHDDHDTRPIT